MKKNIIGFFVCLTSASFAQDQLFKKDNSKVEVKILEINQEEIKYKLFTYQDGPTITISKKDVALIIYQNGVHEVITPKVEETPTTSSQPFVVYNSYSSARINRDSIEKAEFNALVGTKNLVSINIMDPINGSFSVSYLREFANNYLHAYVPVSVGFAAPYFTQAANTIFSGNNNFYYNNYNTSYLTVSDFKFTSKTYEVGLGLHFQTSGKRAVTHFIGPYVGMSQYTGTYTKNEYIYDPYYGYNVSTVSQNETFKLERTYVMLDNGVLFRVAKNFNIMLLAGVGYHIDSYKSADDLTKATNYNKNQFPLNAFKFGLSFGYRF